jgi:hypothetical protein
LLDAFNDLAVLQQVATAGGRAAFLHGFNEAGIVFQHSVDCFRNYLGGILAGAGGNLLKTSFFIRREMNFHRFQRKASKSKCQAASIE